ncbi:MAG: hypothetical protein Q8903_05590 [Bacteroidota bacterium]|nr:hypothetical protein [Bacteroidota bacterium]
MNKNELNNIPDICLNSYQDNSSGLLILGMDELYEKHMKTISRSHRSSLYQLYLIMEGECSICVDSIEHC